MKRKTIKPTILELSENKIIFIKDVTVMGSNHQYIINVPRLLESHLIPGKAVKVTIDNII